MTTEREALKLVLEALKKMDKVMKRSPDTDKAINAAEEVLAQPPEERNFCPRCGKKAGKNAWDVHTCSLPEENT
jgi:hypothetical protein